MARPRLTLARWIAIILFVGLGLAWLKYINRRPPHPAVFSRQFALLGKIDIDRDGQDDRDRLKRMIEEAGGFVVFDLPPPTVGTGAGTLSGAIDWYVTDDRLPLHEAYLRPQRRTRGSSSQFERRVGECMREARLSGVRPMPIEHLLNFLGYEDRRLIRRQR
jgi:hypothetical protein